MRLEVGAVDHDRFAIRSGLGELGEDPGEHAHARPANEPVVERLRRAMRSRRIFPLQPVLLNVDYPAQYPPVIHPHLASGLRKERPQPLHLRVAQPEMPAHHAPSVWELESCNPSATPTFSAACQGFPRFSNHVRQKRT